jgi:hypothetical protein
VIFLKRGELIYNKKDDTFYYYEGRLQGYALSLRSMTESVGIDMNGEPIPELTIAWKHQVRRATREERSALRLMGVR